jgi:hypothetical protein
MNSGLKTKILLLGAIALASSGVALAALTTDELTRLKASGLGEEVIRFMIESDYGNVERVVRLKEAGFADETISTVIRNDLKSGGEAPQRPAPRAEVPATAQPPAAAPEADAATLFRTTGTVKIEQYLVRGEPVVQNAQDIPGATISLLEGDRLKIDWDPAKVPANFFRRKPFAPPFYWDLDKSDGLHAVSQKDNAFVLRTGHAHRGRPETGTARAWVVHVTPDSPELVQRIRALLAE